MGVDREWSGLVQGITGVCQGLYCNLRGNPFEQCEYVAHLKHLVAKKKSKSHLNM